MKTFIGEIGLPIQYKLDDKSICELDNLEYVIDIVEQVDENTLYINNVANEFKRIPGNNIFVTKNGVFFDLRNKCFKVKMYNTNGYAYILGIINKNVLVIVSYIEQSI